MSKLLNIVKSRYIKGENLPGWYEERLQVCSVCPKNSKNIAEEDKNVTRKGWELIAGAHCVECGCTIVQKAKIEQEYCPRNYWKSVDTIVKNRKINITTTSTKADFSYDENIHNYIIDYGIIPYQFDSSFNIIIIDKGISDITTTTSCGCTTANPIFSNSGVEINIAYDTNRVGNFSKLIRINYKLKGHSDSINIKITGQVKTP